MPTWLWEGRPFGQCWLLPLERFPREEGSSTLQWCCHLRVAWLSHGMNVISLSSHCHSLGKHGPILLLHKLRLREAEGNSPQTCLAVAAPHGCWALACPNWVGPGLGALSLRHQSLLVLHAQPGDLGVRPSSSSASEEEVSETPVRGILG